MTGPDSIVSPPPPVIHDTVAHGISPEHGVREHARDSLHMQAGSHTVGHGAVSDSIAGETAPVSAPAAPVVARKPAPLRLGPYYKNYEIHAGVVERPDSIAADSIASDTVNAVHHYGVCLTPPVHPKAEHREDTAWGMSYIFGALLLLFCIAGIRFHNSRKYVTSMLHNLVAVRIRSNVFDDTVRETSFLVLLNLMWSCAAGGLLYGVLCQTASDNPIWSFGVPALATRRALSVAVCMGVGIVYTCFMSVAYYIVGCVFSDRKHAVMWLKGFGAAQGLLSFIYLPLSLLLLCWPEWTEIILWIALGTFIMSKIVFIWKGFRIFFTQFSSWLLFLYYLCSLEIVPLILTYLAGMWLCSLLH